MKIFIEARPLIQRERTGVAHYIWQLMLALSAELGDDDLTAWCINQSTNPFAATPNIRFIGKSFPPLPRAVLERIWKVLPIHCVAADADIYHLPYAVVPARRKSRHTRLVVTVHDLAYLRFPATISDPAHLQLLTLALPRQCAEADRVIADSQSTKADLVELLGIPASKISVILLGNDVVPPAPEEFERPEVVEFWKGVPERYLLFVGTAEPRKNLQLLLRACALIKDQLAAGKVKLCLTGAGGWKQEATESLIAQLQLEPFIVRLGYVPRAMLPLLYARSEAFVFPSLYEGFGFPVLEAMACGAPVITTNVSSLPEVGGDAALYCDPGDAEALAQHISSVLADRALAAALAEAGYRQAARFTWRQTALETLGVYRTALQ